MTCRVGKRARTGAEGEGGRRMQCTEGIVTLKGMSKAAAGFSARMYLGRSEHDRPPTTNAQRTWQEPGSAPAKGAADVVTWVVMAAAR
jgi:hypothetical protein